MKNKLKNCLCLISLGLLCGWAALDHSALKISPVRAASARSVSQQDVPLATSDLTFDKLLDTEKYGFSLAQLPGEPTFKAKRLKEDVPDEMNPQSVPKVPPVSSAPFKPEKTSRRIIDARPDESNQAGLEKAIARVDQGGGVLHFSPGTYNIDADFVLPAAVTVRLDRGALLKIGTQKGNGTLSYSDEECAGTLSVDDGGTQVTGEDTEFGKLLPGQFITCAGQRREIRSITNNTHLEVFIPFHPAITRKAFTKSSYTIKGSGTQFNTELKVGDFLYHGQENHIITSISGPDTLTVAEYPTHTFSGKPFTRSVRVKIQGSLEAGLYQIFSGQGVANFASGTVTSVHPEWWGAKGNNADNQAAANSLAIEKAIHSMVPDRVAKVEFANGTYKINRSIVLLPGTYLSGQGWSWSGTVIALAKRANCHMVKDSLRLHSFSGGLKGILFNNGFQDGGYNGLHLVHNTKLWQIQNCGFVSYTKHPGGYAIYLNPAAQAWIRENFIMGFYNGIYAYGFDSYYLNNEIAASGDYAIFMKGDGNVVHGNILYGDAGCKTGIYSLSSKNTSIIGNRIGPFDNGIAVGNGGGIIEENVLIGNRVNGIYSDAKHGINDAIISNNRIISNKSYGILITGFCVNTIIKNNYLRRNNGGDFNPQIKMDSHTLPAQGNDEPLVEDNVGVDLECAYPILAQNSSPNIRIARRWKTANTKPTMITDFAGGCRGKEIIVIFGDAQTTLKFSGQSRLKGHSGVDWRPAPGDHLRAVKGDDGLWYCESFPSSH
jgi:hypothetical protein